MNKLKYSIIYAALRPEISEQLSIGIILVDETGIEVRYSQKKLAALGLLCSESKQKMISRIVRSMATTIASEDTIHYLSRYSNNLITFSALREIDFEATSQNKEWLYRSYVYDKRRA